MSTFATLVEKRQGCRTGNERDLTHPYRIAGRVCDIAEILVTPILG